MNVFATQKFTVFEKEFLLVYFTKRAKNFTTY